MGGPSGPTLLFQIAP
ncbi:DUF6053 domain-containing protein [Lysobacter enzymogenes]